MKKRDRKKNSQKDNRGTSMATVVVSFALLLLFVTAYLKVQKVAGNMMMSSKDIVRNSGELIKAYYMEETANVTVADSVRLNFSGEAGGFYLDATLKKAEKEGLEGSIYYFAAEDEEEDAYERR